MRVRPTGRLGGTRPVVVDTAAGPRFVKLRGAADGPAALVAEVIVAELAEALGLAGPVAGRPRPGHPDRRPRPGTRRPAGRECQPEPRIRVPADGPGLRAGRPVRGARRHSGRGPVAGPADP